MNPKELTKQVPLLKKEAEKALLDAPSLEVLEELRVAYLGRKGSVTMLLRSLKDISDTDKRSVAPKIQQLKADIESLLASRADELQEESYKKLADTEWVDITQPGTSLSAGSLHPLLQVQEEVEDALIALGFTIVKTPEIESEYYNFEALNIPKHHPARDIQDTFWLQNGFVLRTHTTSFQLRMLEKHAVPIQIAHPGPCFRYEATDASHDAQFHQVDGLMIGTDIHAGHLMGVMKSVLQQIFGYEVDVRLRPGYFPFVEPGMELDFKCLLCKGEGCRVCSHTGWVEFMGCGMVHPNVLKNASIDPNEYQGFAFGFGLTRLVMMRHRIPDIRYLMSGDIRFLEQF